MLTTLLSRWDYLKEGAGTEIDRKIARVTHYPNLTRYCRVCTLSIVYWVIQRWISFKRWSIGSILDYVQFSRSIIDWFLQQWLKLHGFCLNLKLFPVF